LEGLRRCDLVNEVKVNINQCRLAAWLVHNVRVPNLLEQGLPVHMSSLEIYDTRTAGRVPFMSGERLASSGQPPSGRPPPPACGGSSRRVRLRLPMLATAASGPGDDKRLRSLAHLGAQPGLSRPVSHPPDPAPPPPGGRPA